MSSLHAIENKPLTKLSYQKVHNIRAHAGLQPFIKTHLDIGLSIGTYKTNSHVTINCQQLAEHQELICAVKNLPTL